MKKYLILIDNDQFELSKLKSIASEQAQIADVELIGIFVKDLNLSVIEDKFKEIVSNNMNKHIDMCFHVVVDACLSDEEHDLSSIRKEQKLSGVKCMKTISTLLEECGCKYHLSLMTRFFANQLHSLQELQDFQNNKSNCFYAIIRKPVLDDGEIDNGFSPMPLYTNLLPANELTLNYVESFKRILLNIFKEV